MKLRTLAGLLLAMSLAVGAQTALKTVNTGREGQPITSSDLVVRGQTTVVTFSSRSCPKCQALEPKLGELAVKNRQVAQRRVEVDRPGSQGIDWLSPLSRQYNLTSLPYFQIYGADGKLVAEGEPARRKVIEMLMESEIL